MVWMTLVWMGLVVLGVYGGMRIGSWATIEQQAKASRLPPPEGWPARCKCCGVPIGYSVTWAPAVLAMRKDQRDRVKFDLELTFPQIARTGKVNATPPPEAAS